MLKRNLKVIIPSGGDGVRFKEKGYKELKPFIIFNDASMFEHLIKGFKSDKYNVQIIIIIRREFIEQYNNEISNLQRKYKNVTFKYIDKKTEGTTATALHIFDDLNNDDMLLLANCDQIIDLDLDKFIDSASKYDGSLLVFDNEHSNKWSFVRITNDKLVTEVAAKNPISDLAVCGWYFWTKSSDFIKYGILQIVNQDRVNGEYYLCPCFNYAIAEDKKIFAYIINKKQMHGVGTPDDLLEYLKSSK